MQDHLAEMLRPGLTVRTYQDGECLIRQGEQSTHLFYIDKGQVEVLLRLPPSRDTASSTQCAPCCCCCCMPSLGVEDLG